MHKVNKNGVKMDLSDGGGVPYPIHKSLGVNTNTSDIRHKIKKLSYQVPLEEKTHEIVSRACNMSTGNRIRLLCQRSKCF